VLSAPQKAQACIQRSLVQGPAHGNYDKYSNFNRQAVQRMQKALDSVRQILHCIQVHCNGA
jgi:hypothetical protein